jgi:hypothetical protein
MTGDSKPDPHAVEGVRSAYFEQGRTAYQEGKSKKDCRHPEGSYEWEQWLGGYAHAESES